MYGAGMSGGSMGFRKADLENGTTGNIADPGRYDNVSATSVPTITVQPSATLHPAATEEPAPTQGFGSGIIILLAGTFTIGYFCGRYIRK